MPGDAYHAGVAVHSKVVFMSKKADLLALADQVEREGMTLHGMFHPAFTVQKMVVDALRLAAQSSDRQVALDTEGNPVYRTRDLAQGSSETSGLLPCPFCGGVASYREHKFPLIFCDGNECFGPRTTAGNFDDAVRQWNTRVPAQAPNLTEVLEREEALLCGLIAKGWALDNGNICDAFNRIQRDVSGIAYAAPVPTDALIKLANRREDGEMVRVSLAALAEVLLYVQLTRPDLASTVPSTDRSTT